MRTGFLSTDKDPEVNPYDFSLVLGGPLYQLFRRTHLSGSALDLVKRRLVFIVGISWLPLLILSWIEGTVLGTKVAVPFLHDGDTHIRFLIAMPLLILAEIVVHHRVRPVVGQFYERNLVTGEARTKLDAALGAALRLRNSVVAEVLMLIFVYGVGVAFVWRNHAAIEAANWYGTTVDGSWRPSVAGWWLGLVSLPFFQFLLIRWYFRIFIWARLLWRVSRIKLNLVPTHPDGCGGLGFLGGVCFAFAPLIVAQSALLSGTIFNQIQYAGANLLQFKIEIIVVCAVILIAVIAPLLVFVRVLSSVKRTGLREYGAVAQRYVSEFDQKWLRGGTPQEEPLMGSADIQSLADLNNSFEVVRTMKVIPLSKGNLMQLAGMAAFPIVPLSLTMISAKELMQQLLKVLF